MKRIVISAQDVEQDELLVFENPLEFKDCKTFLSKLKFLREFILTLLSIVFIWLNVMFEKDKIRKKRKNLYFTIEASEKYIILAV